LYDTGASVLFRSSFRQCRRLASTLPRCDGMTPRIEGFGLTSIRTRPAGCCTVGEGRRRTAPNATCSPQSAQSLQMAGNRDFTGAMADWWLRSHPGSPL
jgi:hypothetical protein